jgi:hypothetical protein
MSNSSTMAVTLSVDLVRANLVLTVMKKYMMVLLYLVGLIGSLLNVFTFLQKQLRTNPCSNYFLSASTIEFCIVNTFILVQVIYSFNEPLSIYIITTNAWCKMGNYLLFVLPCLASTYIILATIDRFYTSSSHQKFRKMSQLKVSRILILLTFLLWALFSLHIPIWYKSIRETPTSPMQCSSQLNVPTFFIIVDGFFFALFNGAIIPLFLSIFGFLIYHNVRMSRRRTGAQNNATGNRTAITLNTRTIALNQMNQHLIVMLLVQVSLTVIFNIPYIVIYLYGIYYVVPSVSWSLLLYTIFSYIARWFWFMNYCTTFYLNTLSSRFFRSILKKQLISLIRRLRPRIVP